jgi:outer membrane protein assembly factor BamD (BamD/ComL family)
LKASHTKILFIFLLNIVIGESIAFAQSLDSNHPLMKGIEFFRRGKYNEAIASFKYVLVDPTMTAQHPDAYFWIGKSYMGLGNYDEASRNLEYFISRYTTHFHYSEAVYQKGRILFLQKEYENAIAQLSDFAEKYPTSPFISNAYFWIGESLFMLGHFEEAVSVYRQIVQKYPESYKFEASKYRIALLELKKREDELLKLLKWSHMETMKTQNEYRKREKTYEQAIAMYQKRLGVSESPTGAVTVTDENVKEELARRESEINRLKQENDALKKQIEYLSGGGTGISQFDESGKAMTDQEQRIQNEQRLLRIKEDALAVKERLLKVLEQTLLEGGK